MFFSFLLQWIAKTNNSLQQDGVKEFILSLSWVFFLGKNNIILLIIIKNFANLFIFWESSIFMILSFEIMFKKYSFT